jgi:hypothetical protein
VAQKAALIKRRTYDGLHTRVSADMSLVDAQTAELGPGLVVKVTGTVSIFIFGHKLTHAAHIEYERKLRDGEPGAVRRVS